MQAAVFCEVGRPIDVEEIEVAEPRPSEVLMRVVASGVSRPTPRCALISPSVPSGNSGCPGRLAR
jgi:hypothetical protein